MKKSSFVVMLLGTISGVLFALGMCMTLIPEWDAFQPGIIFGCLGLILGLITMPYGEKWNTNSLFRFPAKPFLQ